MLGAGTLFFCLCLRFGTGRAKIGVRYLTMTKMRETGSIKKRMLICLLAVCMMVLGVGSGESRVNSAHFQAASLETDAVYRSIPNTLLSNEACEEKLIDARSRLPEIRSIRSNRRVFRALLTVLALGTAVLAAPCGISMGLGVYRLVKPAGTLVLTIQYIHDLDGKKSISTL